MATRLHGWRWIVVIWVAALLLLTAHLGDLPLRDWDESLVARVSLEISRRSWPHNLLPTLWDQSYLNKPPLLHGLIAAVLAVWNGVHPGAITAGQPPPEWLLRSVPALLSSLVVPLVALVQARLRPEDRLAPVATAAVALTLLPLMRHGRLVMLDGTLISAMTLQWWALLSLGHQPSRLALRRWGLLAGLAGSAILLLKAPAALPLLIGACLLLAFEQRWPLALWRSCSGWILLGLVPGIAWHLWHAVERGPAAAFTMWGGQGLARVVDAVEGHSGGIAVPITEVLEGGWPWLALWPLAMVLAWQQRHSRWGLWVLGLTMLTAALVLPLRTQLPWYSHLLWPAFTVAVAPLLCALVQRRTEVGRAMQPLLRWIPLFWCSCGVVLLGLEALVPVPATIVVPAGLALAVGGGLLLSPSRPWRGGGAITMVVLLWLALFNLFSSNAWLWELNETWPVLPISAQLQALPAQQRQCPVVVDGPGRPSLEWYLGREVQSGRLKRRLRQSKVSDLIVVSEDQPSAVHWRCDPLPTATTPQVFRCTQ